MIIIWGSKLYGKVDEVPGLFHVATKFFHLWYIPLIPTGSWVVFEQNKGGWRGAEIGLSAKSILLSWARGGLIVAAFVLAISGIVAMTDRRPAMVVGGILIAMGVAALGAAIATWVVPAISRASYERAVKIAEHVGLTEEGLVLIELAYKRVSEADAAATLASLRADAQAMKDLASGRGIGGAGDTEAVPLAPPTAPPTQPARR